MLVTRDFRIKTIKTFYLQGFNMSKNKLQDHKTIRKLVLQFLHEGNEHLCMEAIAVWS